MSCSRCAVLDPRHLRGPDCDPELFKYRVGSHDNPVQAITTVWRFTNRVPGTISCCSCGDTEAESIAHDLGWRWQTQFDGEARWLCPDCQEPATDAEGRRIGRTR